MFCPKCGQQNPDTGKFCRSCGTDLGNVSDALTGRLAVDKSCAMNRRGRPVTYESAATKFFMGVAFVAVAIVLGVTGRGGGWWFWMLIPACMFIGSGLAQFIQIRRFEQGRASFSAESAAAVAGASSNASLSSPQPEYLSGYGVNLHANQVPESRYKTGDLVPPSVTDSTTRHLELDPEGKTMTLPKK